MAFWQEIERFCNRIGDGIHNLNAELTCGNPKMAKLLQLFTKRVESKQAEWPENWHYYGHEFYQKQRKPPTFDNRCVTPDSKESYSPPTLDIEIEVLTDDDIQKMESQMQLMRITRTPIDEFKRFHGHNPGH